MIWLKSWHKHSYDIKFWHKQSYVTNKVTIQTKLCHKQSYDMIKIMT